MLPICFVLQNQLGYMYTQIQKVDGQEGDRIRGVWIINKKMDWSSKSGSGEVYPIRGFGLR